MALEARKQHWRRMHELFSELLALEPQQRAPFLDRACEGDDTLRRDLDSLVASYEQAGSFLEEPAVDLAGGPAEDPLVGSCLGPYRILRPLGSGGMGSVYLAERADDAYQHQVAVKVLKQGMGEDGVARRFRTERQILANLDHPMIGRLLDGGSTADGRPYLVMDYIEGEPINRYCDARRLGIRQRLELFRTVCSAVQFAHQNLVIHRDLKPSNILIGPDGTPKLLDFGIAKLLRDDSSAADYTVTAPEAWAFTPAYASPEQIRREPITIGSDVYSLGVLLFELVSGHRPYRVKDLAPLEVARVICQVEPRPPSTAVASGDSQEVSRLRGSDPERLRRRLAGDVDNIVMMALDKDPRRRYASVEQLAEDLRLHLEGRPVRACPNTSVYRAGKFLRRHRWETATAAAVLALILGFAATVAVQRQQFLRQRDVAREVSEFFVQMFEAADPTRTLGERITAREVLDDGARRIVSEMEDRPEVQAALMGTMGRVYANLGLYGDARPLLEEALTARQQLGSDAGEIAESLHHLGLLREEEGEYESAEDLILEALELRREELGDDHTDVARTLRDLGGLYITRRDPEAASGPLDEALRIQRGLPGDARDEIAQTLNDLTLMHQARGDYTAAEKSVREALDLQRGHLGDGHLTVAISLNNLAGVLYRKGDPGAAETLYRQALDGFRRIFGEEHPMVAQGINNVAAMKYFQSEYGAAEDLYRQALAMRRRLLGDDHPEIAMTLNNLGVLLRARHDYQGAEEISREVLGLQRRAFGEEHPMVAKSLNNLALALDDQGKSAAAETILRQALAMYRKTLGAQHLDTSPTLSNLVALLVRRGECAGAKPLLRELLEILGPALDPDHWHLARAESFRGACLVRSGQYEEAEPVLVKSYRILRASRGDEARMTQETLESLKRLYRDWGRPQELARLDAAGSE